ncbi:hypothetical protein N7492_005321 [Penicillium capsulatum]|uniref:Uncharacterized protein n=1 Tax=Penicillium capsulatum TaxID=69766 RepID=A0A9W9IBR3_9EURO|nr:hypothetical protein N7492_005321 [Penicillium capsulatum]KAJ6135576.1 hypothetical protein N7512_000736 [Penicillium capsulatum]
MFLNENDKTARRSAAAKSKTEARRKLLDILAELPETSSNRLPPLPTAGTPRRGPVVVLVPAMPPTVPHSDDERGLKFFFHRFVTAVSGVQGSSYDLESAPLLKTIPVEAPLRNAVVSIGLGALSNVTMDRTLMALAREKYLAAINVVRGAVENPGKANSFQIFKVIVMLSLYEMVCCSPDQIDAWTVHVDGVVALLKQATFGLSLKATDPRGRIQFYLITVVRYFMAPGVLSPDIKDWSPDDFPSSETDLQPAIQLVDMLVRFMKFHSSLSFNLDTDNQNVIQFASSLDDEMEIWERNLPEKWIFVVKESGDLQHTFNGKYVLYNDLWVSRDLNYYHWGRLMLNELILEHLAKNQYPTLGHLKQRQQAMETVSRMATAICAGAASQMGGIGCGAPVKSRTRVPPLNGVFMLLFPLTLAGSAAGAPDEVQAWVIKTFEKIGLTMGIQRALVLIPKLEQDRARKRRQLNME